MLTLAHEDGLTTDADDALESRLIDRIEAFGQSLSRKRADAVSARRESGIEEEWHAAEDAYQGVDDANRGDTRMAKPVSPDGGMVNGPSRRGQTRSTVVMNITRPYVDAAAARVADMLLPTDDTSWGLKPTPIPSRNFELPDAALTQPMGAPPGMGAMMPGQPPFPADPLQQAIQQAKDAAEKATKQIEDWLVQCQWHAEVRKMIEDTARLGTGVLKGPTPARMKSRMMKRESGIMQLVIEESIVPESKCISPWNFFPDGACGENIQDGSGTWERDTLSAKSVRELKALDGYIESQIDRVLEEGPQGKYIDAYTNSGKVKANDRDVYEVWYYYGAADREDLDAAGVELPDDTDVTAHCLVTMVNDRVIKAAINPLDSGEFPYDVMVWQRKSGLPYGTGVAMQISTPQRMLTAAVRNLNDNAGLSAGPQIAMRKSAVTPADGRWELTPRKMWWVNEDSDAQTVQQAFQVYNIPTMQAELQNIAQFAMKMAEDVTGMPALMQGQNTNAPDTVGGMQMMQNNAGTVLRRIARLFDDRVTEPHIRRYYEWLMLNGEDDDCKGDFQIDARGSTALVERDLQNQAIAQMGQLAMNPAFGIDPEKWFSEMLKSQRLDPSRFTMDDEKKAQMAQQQPPAPPQIQVAQIRAEADAAKAEADRQLKAQMHSETMQAGVQKMALDQDRDNVYVQSQTNRDQATHMAKMAELELRRELAMLDYSKQHGVTLEKIKADLAKKAMEINATKELAGMKAPASMLPTPPVEPPQQALPGESFQS